MQHIQNYYSSHLGKSGEAFMDSFDGKVCDKSPAPKTSAIDTINNQRRLLCRGLRDQFDKINAYHNLSDVGRFFKSFFSKTDENKVRYRVIFIVEILQKISQQTVLEENGSCILKASDA